MDRLGQTRVLRAAAVGHALACAALVVAADAGRRTGCWLLCERGAGGLALPAAAGRDALAVERRWRATRSSARPPTRWSSIVFEIAVLTAPALVAAIVALASPEVAVLAAAALVRRRRASRSPSTPASRRWRGEPHDVGWLGPLGAPGMRTVFVVLGPFGTAVGVVQVAAARVRRRARIGGDRRALPRALSAGSLAGGLVYGARTWPGSAARRLPALMLGPRRPASRCWPPPARGRCSPCCCSCCGLLLAPTTVVGSTLLDTAAPAGTVTEAFAVMVMGIVAGTALGNALGGAIVEDSTYEAGALCAGAIALLGAVLALARRRTLA